MVVSGSLESKFPALLSEITSYRRLPAPAPLLYSGNSCDQCEIYSFPINAVISSTLPSYILLGRFSCIGKLRFVTISMTDIKPIHMSKVSVVIQAPNGLKAQIGGSTYFQERNKSVENLYVRTWGSSISTRDCSGSQLETIGSTNSTWEVYLSLTTSIDNVETFSGTLSVSIDDAIPNLKHIEENKMSVLTIVLIVIAVFVACVGISSGIYFFVRYKKRQMMPSEHQQPQQLADSTPADASQVNIIISPMQVHTREPVVVLG